MINKLSFGKIFNKKENTETQKEKQIPENINKEEVAILEKLRGAAAAKYLAALMGVAGAGAMTSCAESEAIAMSDNSQILEFLKQIAENQAKTNEQENNYWMLIFRNKEIKNPVVCLDFETFLKFYEKGINK